MIIMPKEFIICFVLCFNFIEIGSVDPKTAVVNKLINEIFELNATVQAIKTGFINSIKANHYGADTMESNNPFMLKEILDPKIMQKMEQIACVEVIVEQLHQFVNGMGGTGEMDLTFLEEKHGNVKYLWVKLGEFESEIPKKTFGKIVGKTEKLYEIIGGNLKNENKGRREIMEQKVQMEMATMMQEANLETSVEYEQLVQKMSITLGSTSVEQSGTGFVGQMPKMFVSKFVDDISNSTKQLLDNVQTKLDCDKQKLIGHLVNNLNMAKMGKMTQNGLKDHSEFIFKLIKEKAGVDWHKVQVYSDDMTNWRMAMIGMKSILGAFIGPNSVAKCIMEAAGAKGRDQNQRNDQNREKCREQFEKWMYENLRLMKTAYGRMFIAVQPIDAHRRQKLEAQKRRRKRGAGQEEKAPLMNEKDDNGMSTNAQTAEGGKKQKSIKKSNKPENNNNINNYRAPGPEAMSRQAEPLPNWDEYNRSNYPHSSSTPTRIDILVQPDVEQKGPSRPSKCVVAWKCVGLVLLQLTIIALSVFIVVGLVLLCVASIAGAAEGGGGGGSGPDCVGCDTCCLFGPSCNGPCPSGGGGGGDCDCCCCCGGGGGGRPHIPDPNSFWDSCAVLWQDMFYDITEH